jgi:hypothetical protein
MTTDRVPMFSIEFRDAWLPPDDDEPSVRARLGTLWLGEHRETFVATIGSWSEEDYIRSWQRAVGEVLATPLSRAALITSVAGEQACPFLRWWPMYRKGQAVLFQEHLVLERPPGWSWSEPWRHMEAHLQLNEDGERISEWVLPVESLEAFLRTLGS